MQNQLNTNVVPLLKDLSGNALVESFSVNLVTGPASVPTAYQLQVSMV